MAAITAVMDTQFAEQFRQAITAEANLLVRELREQAFAFFTMTGYPHVKLEDWKYTNVAPLAKESWTTKNQGPRTRPACEWREISFLTRQTP